MRRDSWKKVGMALADSHCPWEHLAPYRSCRRLRERTLCLPCRAKALRARDRKRRKP